VLKRLLDHARANFESYPAHALEITTVVVEAIEDLDGPDEFRPYLVEFSGDAWREHANALSGRLRPQDAMRASARARELYLQLGGASDAKVALVDLVDATCFHEMGDSDRALTLARGAAKTLRKYKDAVGEMNARIIEGWILYSRGQHDEVRSVWTAAAKDAEKLGNRDALARLHNNIGHLACELGDLEAASDSFERAIKLFEELNMLTERPKVRWGHAKILRSRGRSHEALSEFFKTEAEFLLLGSVGDAALAALATVELLIVLGRSEQAKERASELVVKFGEAGMLPNALTALAFLRECAHIERLSIGNLDHVSKFFRELGRDPLLTFMRPPEPQV
jgi:tetratricopeptide (TPR) repeat protein